MRKIKTYQKVIWRSQFVRELEEVEGWDSLGTAALNDEVIFLFGIKQVVLVKNNNNNFTI